MNDPSAMQIIDLLDLVPLPEEGGLYRQTHRDAHGTAIYYLIGDVDPGAEPEFSALHRLPGAEVFHHYAGAPVRMLLLHPDGAHEERVLGPGLTSGHRPQIVVPGGTWQGCRSAPGSSGPRWSLLGATMAPGYAEADFELSAAAPLIAGWPAAADQIRRLTRA